MLLEKLHPHRWFVWTLVVLVVVGLGLVSYLQWVNTELYTENLLLTV